MFLRKNPLPLLYLVWLVFQFIPVTSMPIEGWLLVTLSTTVLHEECHDDILYYVKWRLKKSVTFIINFRCSSARILEQSGLLVVHYTSHNYYFVAEPHRHAFSLSLSHTMQHPSPPATRTKRDRQHTSPVASITSTQFISQS